MSAPVQPNQVYSILKMNFNWSRPIPVTPIVSGNSDIFKVEYAGKHFILKIYREGFMSGEVLNVQLEFLSHLRKKHFLAISPTRTVNGRFYSLYKNRLCVLFDHAPGNSFPYFTNETITRLGEALAYLHNTTASFSDKADYPVMNTEWLIRSPTQYIYKELRNYHLGSTLFDDAVNRLEKDVNSILNSSIPVGIFHGDPHFSNMYLQENGLPFFFDFDHSRFGPLSHDIAFIRLLSLSKKNIPRFNYDNFLLGYERVRKLEQGEHDAIPSLMAGFHIFAMGHHCKFRGDKYPDITYSYLCNNVDVLSSYKTLDCYYSNSKSVYRRENILGDTLE